MNRTTFERAASIAASCNDSAGAMLNCDAVLDALRTLTQVVGPEHMPFMRLQIGLLDRTRQCVVDLNRIEWSCDNDGGTLCVGYGPTAQTCRVGAQSLTIPDDLCPRCGGQWDSKWHPPHACTACGATLGDGVRIVLFPGSCPRCEEGRISEHSPQCAECGFEPDAAHVEWDSADESST
jgi:predicted RNA-binding Zn-ribbon protein involved in translation (DUF1610 family)